MLSKTITYTDYDGVERTEEFHFNLSKAELIEMEMSASGGLQKMLKRIVASQDNKEIFGIFKEIILKSYGVKSDDGRNFRKSPELAADFVQTEAFSELVMELLKGQEFAHVFVRGIVPQSLLDDSGEMPPMESATVSDTVPPRPRPPHRPGIEGSAIPPSYRK